MKRMIRTIAKHTIHAVTGTRKFYYAKLRERTKNVKNKTILELGSGKAVNGKYPYSAQHLFDASNNFLCTDINPSFGHQVLDITKMQYQNRYDVVLCLNILEHVFETEKALQNLHRSLKKGGVTYIAVPVHFPLHDEPHDYWRFTEHSLRRLLADFSNVKIYHRGPRVFPFGYFVEARK